MKKIRVARIVLSLLLISVATLLTVGVSEALNLSLNISDQVINQTSGNHSLNLSTFTSGGNASNYKWFVTNQTEDQVQCFINNVNATVNNALSMRAKGNNDGVVISTQVIGRAAEFSQMVLINPIQVDNYQFIFNKRGGGFPSDLFFVIDQNNLADKKLCGSFFNTANAFQGWLCSANDLTPGVWTLASHVFNGTHEKIYINDKLEAIQTATGPLRNLSSTETLGLGFDFNPAFDYGGLIDEVYLFNRTLTVDEINSTFKRALQHLRTNISLQDLKVYYSFDQDARDDATGTHNGTLQNQAFITSSENLTFFPVGSFTGNSSCTVDVFDGVESDTDAFNIEVLTFGPIMTLPDFQIQVNLNTSINLSLFTTNPRNLSLTWAVFNETPSIADCNVTGDTLSIFAGPTPAITSCTLNVTDSVVVTFDTTIINVTSAILPSFNYNVSDVGIDFICTEW